MKRHMKRNFLVLAGISALWPAGLLAAVGTATAPTGEEILQEGMRGNETVTVPTPQGTMWLGMQPHPRRQIAIANERDMVGMPLDDPPSWDQAIGRHHIIDMDRKFDPIQDMREGEALTSTVP